MDCLSRPYYFKFFKGSLPQILLGPFLNICPIYDGAFLTKIVLVQYFEKKPPSQMFDRVLSTPLNLVTQKIK